jgi:hypothetical protein
MQSNTLIEIEVQRRSSVRYRLQLPVIFHWTDDGEFTEGGFTYDIALNGVLICSTKCPPVGSDVRIEVLVPSPANSSEQLRILCVGKVTRSVVEGAHCTFGVKGWFDDNHIIRQLVQ